MCGLNRGLKQIQIFGAEFFGAHLKANLLEYNQTDVTLRNKVFGVHLKL